MKTVHFVGFPSQSPQICTNAGMHGCSAALVHAWLFFSSACARGEARRSHCRPGGPIAGQAVPFPARRPIPGPAVPFLPRRSHCRPGGPFAGPAVPFPARRSHSRPGVPFPARRSHSRPGGPIAGRKDGV